MKTFTHRQGYWIHPGDMITIEDSGWNGSLYEVAEVDEENNIITIYSSDRRHRAKYPLRDENWVVYKKNKEGVLERIYNSDE